VLRDLMQQLEPRRPCALDAAVVPEQFLRQLTQMHATLTSRDILDQLARLVALEETVYRAGHKINYLADRFGIDALTDTAERSPTYCTPPFRKFDDVNATDSWSFLFVPHQETAQAWKAIIKREPRCIEWTEAEVMALVGEQNAPRTCEILRKIRFSELMRFRVGLDGLNYRPLGKGDGAVAIISSEEKSSLLSTSGFHRVQLEAARQAGANIALLAVGGADSLHEIDRFIRGWAPDCAALLVPAPNNDFLLDGVTRVGLKMLLNALSTCTMVRLGRVMGNYMIWVVPSNLKLIDRSTRYIQKLTGLDYRAANKLLFEVIEYIEPRMKADQAYPPVVGLAVMRTKYGIGNEEAEKRLIAETG